MATACHTLLEDNNSASLSTVEGNLYSILSLIVVYFDVVAVPGYPWMH